METAETKSHPTFTDMAGRAWTVVITHGVALRVKKELKVNLHDLLKNKGKALGGLLADTEQLVNVVAALLRADLEKAQVGPEDFSGSLDGTALEALGKAFLEAVGNFSGDRSGATLRSIIAKSEDVAGIMQARALAKMDGLDPGELAEMMMKQQEAEARP